MFGSSRTRLAAASVVQKPLTTSRSAGAPDQHTMKNSPLAFVQAGPMDPWAPMQKAFLDALVLH